MTPVKQGAHWEETEDVNILCALKCSDTASNSSQGVERRPEDLWLSALHQPLHSTSIIRVQVQLIKMLQKGESFFSALTLKKNQKNKQTTTQRILKTAGTVSGAGIQPTDLLLWILLKHHITLWPVEVAWGPGFGNQSVPIYLHDLYPGRKYLSFTNVTGNGPGKAGPPSAPSLLLWVEKIQGVAQGHFSGVWAPRNRHSSL